MLAGSENRYHSVCIAKCLKAPDCDAGHCPLLCSHKLVTRDVRSRSCYCVAKAEMKGGRPWEHQLKVCWGAAVVQLREKGEPGSDLPFKTKCAMNKCIAGLFGVFFPRVVIPDYFPPSSYKCL